ncbi:MULTISPECIES: GlxA family transcriptional regulator [Photorhabdus]|uniref:AraC family transcriptional regulator with amidase-like domain n=2 Tax=Photorhabdus asymbiotica TaxID=291112 RepID=A0ABX9SJF4_9GAMM|nr:helix-turn-helix domain-containing protein [Photorhabdus asymbiotica]RKS54059.1 AraC family transcriptional regulator with amidase-like domain [Photorhabdus asymbiotica]CAQ85168.1 similar to arac-family transcriptional regulator [Photorhabdus asymbiotica]CAR67490.1 similar to arac-family transcriptional regulator [Photorhabdus asymbiotica subsp. asymbiotica ATCC 43949]
MDRNPVSLSALAFSGGSLTSITGPIEILTLAAHLAGAPEPEINIVTQDNQDAVGLGGVRLKPNKLIREIKQTDIVLVGSIGIPDNDLDSCTQETLDWLQRMEERNIPIVSICSGSFVLAKANLLNNRKATTHWLLTNSFKDMFPQVQLHSEIKVTRDNNIFCTSGTYEYNDVMMHIVEQIYGYNTRETCSQLIFGNMEGAPPHTLASFVPYRQHSDTLIHKLQDWMHSAPSDILSVGDLANKIHLCERQMKRRFKTATGQTPIQYIQQIRLSLAKYRLEKSNKTIEEISHEVGYEDTRYFRELFKKLNGVTPIEYRKKYQYR